MSTQSQNEGMSKLKGQSNEVSNLGTVYYFLINQNVGDVIENFI